MDTAGMILQILCDLLSPTVNRRHQGFVCDVQ